MRRPLSLFIGFVFILVAFIYDHMQAPDREILIDNSQVQIVDTSSYSKTPLMPSMPVIISDSRAQHILYGDGKGGGHKFGVGKPCKSEFPESWDDKKILSITRKIAANDNLAWKQQGNGYYVAESFEDNIRVRVVKGPQKRRVITAYPTNVTRNPCPL
ncbi:MAG: EndoU domain-containing protein [Bdellovibrionales bacterium]